MENKKIYILILNFNAWKDAIECLQSVIGSSYTEFQIILVDNSSPNNSEEKLIQWMDGKLEFDIENPYFRGKVSTNMNGCLPYISYSEGRSLKRDLEHENEIYSKFVKENGGCILEYPIIFVQTGNNLGFAGGNNVVLRSLISSNEDANVLLLNPDTFLEQNALSELSGSELLIDRFLMGMTIKSYSHPQKLMSIGGSRILKLFGIVKDITNYEDLCNMDYIYGGALFTNTTTLRFIGEMPESYFLYWEETDWCYTAQRNGVKLLVCSKSVCYDKVGTSIGRGFLSEYYFTFNSLLFYKKHLINYKLGLVVFHLVRMVVKLIKFKLPQSKAIFFALIDFCLGRRREVI